MAKKSAIEKNKSRVKLTARFAAKRAKLKAMAKDSAVSPEDQFMARLALAKAQAVLASHPEALVIGADQMACCAGRVLGKPESVARAEEQLQWLQGRRVEYLNGIAIADASGAEQFIVPYSLTLRALSPEDIRRYIEKDQPLDCAGSLRSEGLGISLLEKMEGADPNALMGMPLLTISEVLRRRGYALA